MDEILKELPVGALVLDLGSAQGSFSRDSTLATAIRFDQEAPARVDGEIVVLGNAAYLPFADRVFQAVISNHSLEHFQDLERSLEEIGRVIDPRGALFVSVPDASTLTDKLYRWLARGGGHVNAFFSPEEVISAIERTTGLGHVATKTLCSSLSFLNRRDSPRPRPRRLLLLGGGFEWSLLLYTWVSRRIDCFLHARTSVYGWAFYFGEISSHVSTGTNLNVCIRCGSGTPAAILQEGRLVRAWLHVFRRYTCPRCGAANPFIEDKNLT